MIAEFEDFCLWMYMVVDELWDRLPASDKRGGSPAPACSDGELLTLAAEWPGNRRSPPGRRALPPGVHREDS